MLQQEQEEPRCCRFVLNSITISNLSTTIRDWIGKHYCQRSLLSSRRSYGHQFVRNIGFATISSVRFHTLQTRSGMDSVVKIEDQ